MKYTLIPKTPIQTDKTEHREFALMDEANKVSIARELQNRHLFLLPADLLTITEAERNIYFSKTPFLDKPTEFAPPAPRISLRVEVDYRNSKVGSQVHW